MKFHICIFRLIIIDDTIPIVDIESQIIDLFKQYDIKVNSIRLVNEGINSRCYRVEGDRIYALKVSKFPERKKKVLKEVEIRSEMCEFGFDFIPPHYFTDTEIFPNSAVAYEYIEGDLPNFEDPNIIDQFALIISQVHSHNLEEMNGLDMVNTVYESLLNHENKMMEIFDYLVSDELRKALIEARKYIRVIIDQNQQHLSRGLISRTHGDLSDNFIADQNGKIWLIDWESSEINDTLEDILFFVFINLNKEQYRTFTDAYKRYLPQANNINIDARKLVHDTMTPIFYIYWNLDFIHTYLKNDLDIKPKIEDLISAAEMAKDYFPKQIADSIINSVKRSPLTNL